MGSVELERVTGAPQVFVIGGGGSGIGVYRRLQRKGVPFAAGILQENDLDYPVARELAAELVSVPPFAAMDENCLRQAEAVMDRCEAVVCCVKAFGPSNEVNRALLSRAGDKLREPDQI